MAQSFTIEGLSDCLEALRELPKATGKNILKRVLLKAGEPIAQDAASRAPHRTFHLRESIIATDRLSQRQRGLNQKESSVEVFVGAGVLPQAHLQEFGTRYERPQPFLRPAWDSKKMAALDSIKIDLWAEIDKARERLARKAARLAALK